MSVQTALETRTARLAAILEDSNEALGEKGGAQADSLTEIPTCIRGISASGSAPKYPVLEVPAEYLEYVEYCRENLYSGTYADLVVWENDEFIAVSFLMENFSVESYDPYTSELTATGWHTCGYTKATGEWTYADYTDEESPGESFAKNIVFASCEIVYGGQTLFPVGVMTALEADSVTFDDDAGTCTVELATGQTEVLTFTYDDSGEVNGVTVRGRTITLDGVI